MPLRLQGGAEVLGFASQDAKSLHKHLASSLRGIIATSPLIQQTEPAPKLLRWIGAKASYLVPNVLIPAPIQAEVWVLRSSMYFCISTDTGPFTRQNIQ